MGKQKKKKVSKVKPKHHGKSQKKAQDSKQSKNSKKRGRNELAPSAVDLDSQIPASPRSKVRKQVEVREKADQIVENSANKTNTEVVEDNTGVNNNATPSNSDATEIDEQLVGVKTRSKGDLTQEELRAELPTGKKTNVLKIPKGSKSKVDKQIPPSGQKVSQALGPPVNVAAGETVQVEIHRADDDAESSEEDSSSSEESEDSSESTSSSGSSSSEEDEVEKGACARRPRSKTKSKRKNLTSSDSESESDASADEYHQKILKANPGLKAYIEKRKGHQKQAKERRKKRKSKLKRTKNKRSKQSTNILNSPSNSTIYAPALNKIVDDMSPQVSVANHRGRKRNRNSDLVKGMRRIDLHGRSVSKEPSIISGGRQSSSSEAEESGTDQEEHDRAIHKAAEDMIVNSEKFKATATVLPEGKSPQYDYNNDADFMVSTCHVDTSIGDKARSGKFVELDKLLNKSLKDITPQGADKYRLDLVNKEGQSYLVASTPDKDVKITGYRRWEQAFKVYMIMFSESNPTRATEILAYADIISNAAQNFVWENVAMYDFYFRKLMDKHPNRSWARTHTQLWSLMMREHLSHKPSSSGFSPGGKSNLRDICCWRYNKGKCTRGPDCKFEHRCSGLWLTQAHLHPMPSPRTKNREAKKAKEQG